MFLYETCCCGVQRWVVWQQTDQQQKREICGFFGRGDQLLNVLRQSQILLIIFLVVVILFNTTFSHLTILYRRVSFLLESLPSSDCWWMKISKLFSNYLIFYFSPLCVYSLMLAISCFYKEFCFVLCLLKVPTDSYVQQVNVNINER